jgi:hypothetical protein
MGTLFTESGIFEHKLIQRIICCACTNLRMQNVVEKSLRNILNQAIPELTTAGRHMIVRKMKDFMI